MSAITIDNDLVHYEVLGRGRPVILIHGWLGSWRYWIPVMQQLSANYRVYALDLWGFGDSQKNPTRYSLQSQVNLLAQFMEKLGINKAALVGHSLGAAIAISFARRHETLTSRVMTISLPLFAINGDALPALSAAIIAKKATGTVPAVSTATTPATPSTPSVTPTATPATPTTATVSAATATPALTAKPTINTAAAPITTPKPAEVLTAIPVTTSTPAVTTTTTTPATSITPAPNPTSVVNTPAPTIASPSSPLPTSTIPSPIPPAAPPPAAVNDDTIRRNPFLDNPDRLAQLGITPPGPVPNPLAGLLGSIKPKSLLDRQLIRDDEALNKLRDEVDKTDEAAFAESIRSFAGVNLALDLCHLSMPVLLLHGKSDSVLPAPEDDLLGRISGGKAAGPFFPLVVPDFRHFPMLENTSKFNRLLMDFLDAKLSADAQINLDLRETWRRQLR